MTCNSLTTHVPLIQKLVRWFALQMKWVVSVWEEHWLLMGQLQRRKSQDYNRYLRELPRMFNLNANNYHYVKSVQIRSIFWSVFSCIRTEYGYLLRKSPYSVRIQGNTDQKKLRIWTLFTKCTSNNQLSLVEISPPLEDRIWLNANFHLTC